MSRKSFWNPRVFSSFCEGSRMVRCNIFRRHSNSHLGGGTTRHSNSQCKKISGHTWKFMAFDRRRQCARNLWFNKVTTYHTYKVSVDILRNIFPRRYNSRIGGTFWPPRTPDLTDANTLKARAFQQVFRNWRQELGKRFPWITGTARKCNV